MPEMPEWWERRMNDIGGFNYRGEPNLRTIWSPETRKWNGAWKYAQPDFPEKPMECWIVETWMPPHFFGEPEDWNFELMGAFPKEGFYGLKTILMHPTGEAMPLTEATFELFQQKQLLDIQWNESDAKERAEYLERQQREREEAAMQEADKHARETFDHYHAHTEELNNDDNRVFSLPKHLDTQGVGSKLPVKI